MAILEKKSGLESMYQHHHTQGQRYGKVHLRKVRAAFLRNSIGTGKEVLDIGVRDGELASYYMPGNTVDGVDIDSDALKVAAERGINTRHIDLNGEWGITKKYDVVVAGETLEHLFYPGEISKKVATVLKPKGIFLGTVPNAFNLKRRLKLLFLNKQETSLDDPTHINHFIVKELYDILAANFREVRIIGYSRFGWLGRTFPQAVAFDLFFEARNPIHR